MGSTAGFATKQKIVQAAMAVIAEEGLEKTTVRKIATRAGVNIAAVNYHFGGKDAVINQSFTAVTMELRNCFRFLKEDDGPGTANLSMFINEYTDIMFKYPDLLKNAIDQFIRHRVADADYFTFLQTEGIELIKAMLGRIRPELDQIQVHMKALQLISAMSWPFLFGDQTLDVFGIDMHDAATRHRYTGMVLQSACSSEG